MKKISVLLSVVIALGAFLFVACSEQDGVDYQTKSVQIGLEIEKADLLQTKSGALDGDGDETVPYCDEDLDFEGYVKSVVTIISDAGRVIENATEWAWDIKLDDYGGVNEDDHLARLSALRQIDLEDGESSVTISFNSFEVYKGGDAMSQGGDLVFVTPKVGSAYEKYVTTPVGDVLDVTGAPIDNNGVYSEVAGIYTKEYIKIDVLCFNEEDIPLFGFAWTDFEVVYGDEITMFFNCTGTGEAYHSVVDVPVFAYQFDATDYYWEKPIGAKAAFSIPCPGDWDKNNGNGFDILVDGYGKINIPQTVIDAYLAGKAYEITSGVLVDTSDDSKNVLVENGTTSEGVDYTLTLDFANENPFLHFYFDTCK